MAEALLSVHGVSKRYGRVVALDRVSFDVASGDSVAIVGENGAGKSTLLGICAGRLRPDAGSVRVRGQVGFCPQEPGLVDLLTADEHLVYFGAARGLDRHRALEHGRELLAEVGFPYRFTETLVRDMSGGTRQKLNVAVALLGDPDVLLLDEPYQGFDHGSYLDFWKLVGQRRERGNAVVVVTHMLAELDRVDRFIELRTAGALE